MPTQADKLQWIKDVKAAYLWEEDQIKCWRSCMKIILLQIIYCS